MNRILSVLLLLTACVSAIWAVPATSGDTSRHTPFAFAVEGSLAPGLNRFALRGMQLSAAGGLSFGKYVSVWMGVGVRHAYSLVSIDRNVYGYGEADQRNYGDRMLLPLFVRVKGQVPVGTFSWAGTSFVPFARLDVGYAVDIQQSTRQRTSSGPFFIPAAGLDMRLQSGKTWLMALGLGMHASQYLINNHSGGGSQTAATGKALSLNVTLGYTF